MHKSFQKRLAHLLLWRANWSIYWNYFDKEHAIEENNHYKIRICRIDVLVSHKLTIAIVGLYVEGLIRVGQ